MSCEVAPLFAFLRNDMVMCFSHCLMRFVVVVVGVCWLLVSGRIVIVVVCGSVLVASASLVLRGVDIRLNQQHVQEPTRRASRRRPGACQLRFGVEPEPWTCMIKKSGRSGIGLACCVLIGRIVEFLHLAVVGLVWVDECIEGLQRG